MEPTNEEEKSGLERAFEMPARLLEEGLEFAEKEEAALVSKRPIKMAEEYWNTLGPGLVTGASDDDPSGIATYSQAGAQYGFKFLWLSWSTFPLMATIQEMCARIGLVTGHGLAANIRRNHSKTSLYVITILLFIANTFNIGADLGAMAQGAQLIAPGVGSFVYVIAFALLSLLLQIFTTYARYARYMKYLAFVLFAYILSALMSGLNWGEVLRSAAIPSLSLTKDGILLICAILGTTISPYLFFWQTSQEVEEENLKGLEHPDSWAQEVSPVQIKRMKSDVWSGMLFSNIVMFFIIAACAGTLFKNGITNIASAADAALALRPFAGNFAFTLFAIGIMGTGMLAIPVLAGSTSYALSEGFGWKNGLYRKLKEAYAFYGVIIVSILFGILINASGIDPIKALIYSAVANAIIAPVILIYIVRMASSEKVMGPYKNKRGAAIVGWITTGLMVIAGIAAIYALF